MSLYLKIVGFLNKSHAYRVAVAAYKRKQLRKHPYKEIERVYNLAFNKKPNIENPSNLIEKIYWMELYADLSLWTKCADKYLVRKYVKECGCESYLPKLIGKWDSVDQFTINDLPDKFIIKTNNGCGNCIPVKDKSLIKEDVIKNQLRKWLEIPYGLSNSQLHYLSIPRCIIAEQLLENDEQSNRLSPNSLIDYKIWCINGKAECVLVVFDRRSGLYCLDLYDVNWNRMKEQLYFNNHYEFRESLIPKPNCLSELIGVAEKLSKPFPEVRVDFYIINNKPYFGELTFSTGYGYFTEEYYQYLGQKIDLSKIKKAEVPNFLSII